MSLLIIEETKEENKDNTKQEKPNNKTWHKILDHIDKGNYNEGYNLALSKNNDAILLKLMKKTGPIIEMIQEEIVDRLMNKITNLIVIGKFDKILLKWITTIIDIRLKISEENKTALVNSLKTLCNNEKESLTKGQLKEITRVIKLLNTI